VMMTGDNRTTALFVAGKLGIDEVEAEVLPEDKAKVVQRLRAEGRAVAMAGDGVNDAPALAAAEVLPEVRAWDAPALPEAVAADRVDPRRVEARQ